MMRYQRSRQEETKVSKPSFEGTGHVLGGDSHIGGSYIQASTAAERRKLQLREQLSSNSTNPQAHGMASQTSEGPLANGAPIMSSNSSATILGTLSTQTRMRGGEASTHLFSTGSAYNTNAASMAAQSPSDLSTTSAAQAGEGDREDMDMDLDAEFMLPFSSP